MKLASLIFVALGLLFASNAPAEQEFRNNPYAFNATVTNRTETTIEFGFYLTQNSAPEAVTLEPGQTKVVRHNRDYINVTGNPFLSYVPNRGDGVRSVHWLLANGRKYEFQKDGSANAVVDTGPLTFESTFKNKSGETVEFWTKSCASGSWYRFLVAPEGSTTVAFIPSETCQLPVVSYFPARKGRGFFRTNYRSRAVEYGATYEFFREADQLVIEPASTNKPSCPGEIAGLTRAQETET